MPGQSDGICNKNDLIASVPPVDAPIINNFSLLTNGCVIKPVHHFLLLTLTDVEKKLFLACDAALILSAMISVLFTHCRLKWTFLAW